MARRLRAGYTRDPYECCGTPPESEYGRKKGAICAVCRRLIDEATAQRARGEQLLAAGERQPYAYTGVHYDHRFYEGATGCSYSRDDLTLAFYTLCTLVTEPAAGANVKVDWYGHTTVDGAPALVDGIAKDRAGYSDVRHRAVLASPAVRDALNALDAAVRHHLTETYERGKQDGARVLHGLARGEVSVQDFDDALLTADERAVAQRRRRGY